MRATIAAVLVALVPALALCDEKKDEKKPEEKKPVEEKTDPLYLDGQEKVELKDPGLKVVRPSKDWVFLNLELRHKRELERAGGAKAVADQQARTKAQLWYGSAGATFTVYSWTDEREELAIATLGEELLGQTRSYLKDQGKVLANAKTKKEKHEAWGFEVEGTLNGGAEPILVSKMVVFRAADKRVFLLALEHPKKHADLVKKDKAKLFSNVKM